MKVSWDAGSKVANLEQKSCRMLSTGKPSTEILGRATDIRIIAVQSLPDLLLGNLFSLDFVVSILKSTTRIRI